MPAERSAVRAALETVGATPVMFEDRGPQDVSAEQSYLEGVRSSDIYVGMWGLRYGVRMADGYSATHAEFLEAERNGLRLCVFVHGDSSGEMDGPQRDLVQGARNLYTTSSWTDPADLGRRVQRRLEDLAAEDLAPWVRVGRAVFRATEIVDDGRMITIKAEVRSDAVHGELVDLRDQRRSGLPFASPTVARAVKVIELTTRTVSTVGREVHLVLQADEQQIWNMRPAINGVSADEVTRRAISDGLFGSSTLGDAAFLAKPVDPLGPLRGVSVDDAVLRPVARLLFTERMLMDATASRIDAFELGPSQHATRRLRATWTPPRTYSNGPDPEPLSIDGSVRGL